MMGSTESWSSHVVAVFDNVGAMTLAVILMFQEGCTIFSLSQNATNAYAMDPPKLLFATDERAIGDVCPDRTRSTKRTSLFEKMA